MHARVEISLLTAAALFSLLDQAASATRPKSCAHRYVALVPPSVPAHLSRCSRAKIKAIKDDLVDKNAPFGVDLLLPQVGGNARKTNVSSTSALASAMGVIS